MQDIVVVATPVYGLSFPAPLKAVFDRTQQYYEAYISRHIKHPFEKPKKGILLSVYGSNDKRGGNDAAAITVDIFGYEYPINRDLLRQEILTENR